MRTTIRLPDDLIADAKRLAAETHRTFTRDIEDSLREALARYRRPRKGNPTRLTTFRGTGLSPSVDLEASATLLEAMESPRAAGRR